MRNEIYPNVLIISGEPFNSKSATGITLSNLFQGWPKHKIMQIYTADIGPDVSICENSTRVSNKDLLLVNVFYQCISKITLKSSGAIFTSNISMSEPPKKKKRKEGLIRNILVSLLDFLPYRISRDILSQVKEFNPDVIYSPLGNIRLVRLVKSLSVTFSTPFVAHFMDDWLFTYSSAGRSAITKFQREYINRLTHALVCKSFVGLGISDVMAEEYSKRFGIPFLTFMSPVSLQYLNTERTALKKEAVTFIYVGGFHLGRYENLIDIGQAIAKIREAGINVRLLIYAPQEDIKEYSKIMLNDGVKFCGTIASHEVQDVFVQADVAIHVESFREKFIQYTRLSLSTKLPQYCAAALPILAYGPNQIASCRYVYDHDCGVTIGYKDANMLVKAIRELAIDEASRKKLGSKGLLVARKHHDEIKVREDFRIVLQN